ncbi:MAG: hypothetical protein IPP96_16990 [Chitinophagaceae bacterium]|nr:hypothetical protein [Chitinophagaceae bacterium]
MTLKVINIFTLVTVLLFASCNSSQQKDAKVNNQPAITKVDTFHIDSTFLKEAFQQEDTAYNEYLAGRLKPIRENFKRINSITKWTSVDKEDLDESTEGGEATFYYSSGVLEKIATRHFGETSQALTEYYLLNGQLSFVFEKSYKYNRPIYYDSAAMKENKDNQTFNMEKSEVIENRSYFEKGRLLHQVNNQDCGSPFAKEYLLEEQKRLIADFDKLKTITKQN